VEDRKWTEKEEEEGRRKMKEMNKTGGKENENMRRGREEKGVKGE
jgi:hypothetical protein